MIINLTQIEIEKIVKEYVAAHCAGLNVDKCRLDHTDDEEVYARIQAIPMPEFNQSKEPSQSDGYSYQGLPE